MELDASNVEDLVADDEPSEDTIFVAEISVIDPETNLPVHIAIYKDKHHGGLFGIDSSFVEQEVEDDGMIYSPFDGDLIKID